MRAIPLAETANYNIHSNLIDALKIALRDVEATRQEYYELATSPMEVTTAVSQVRSVQHAICSVRERYLDECGALFDLASEISIFDSESSRRYP